MSCDLLFIYNLFIHATKLFTFFCFQNCCDFNFLFKNRHNIPYRQKTADIDASNESISSSTDVSATFISTKHIATQTEETFCSTAVEPSYNG